MSMMLMVKAMQLKVGNPLRKLVLIKLADNANDMGECYPSHQHVADQCEISKTSVRNHIRELERMGFLRVEHRDGPKGNTSNLYHLTLQGIAAADTGMPAADTGGVAGDDTRISNSFEPVIEPVIEPKEPLSKPSVIDCEIKQVIDLLNSMTGSKYRSSTASHSKNISGRLGEGHSVDDLMAVVRFKCQEWLHDPKMSQYLRPETLFSAGKFNGYLMATKAASSPLAELSAVSRQNAQNLMGKW